MTQLEVVAWAAVTGLISAVATGLGALPVALLPHATRQAKAFLAALAAGMMISASVFSLAQEGIDLRADHPTAPYEVIAGMLAGGAFFWSVARGVERWIPAGASAASRRSTLVFLAMLVHSAPEGIAIGVGFASGRLEFGLLIALAISVHNVPEGMAISLPMRAAGASIPRCAWMSILSSVPQPLLAPPAAWLVWLFQPLLPAGMGFAAGAMIYLVVHELLPDALEEASPTVASWGVLTGLCAMLLLTTLIDDLTGL